MTNAAPAAPLNPVLSLDAYPEKALVSLIIPVYNEEENVRVLVKEIVAAMERQNRPWQALFIDDGSTDASLAVLRTVAAEGAVGPYGIIPLKLLLTNASNTVIDGVKYTCPDPTDEDTSGEQVSLNEMLITHQHASNILACQMQIRLTSLDSDFTPESIVTGIKTVTKPDGSTTYEIESEDGGAQHVRETLITMFSTLPIPNATARAERLYDLTIRAALGILDSCGDTTTAVGMAAPGTWVSPTTGQNTSEYGWRVHPVYSTHTFHTGVDLAPPCGTPIVSVADGVVLTTDWTGGYGGLTVIDHGSGITSYYAHQEMSQMTVRPGDRVTAGQQIGQVATTGTSTGCHLHFELRQEGTVDPNGGTTIDPAAFLSERGVTLGSATDAPNTGGEPLGGKFQAADAEGTMWLFDKAYQVNNARTLVTTGQQMGMSEKVILAALSTGMVESRLTNLANQSYPETLNYPHDAVASGDHDSAGVMQQRPQSGWGTFEQILSSVEYQATKFYEAAMLVEAANPGMTAGDIAYAVQQCDELYAGRYALMMPVAEAMLRALGGFLTSQTPECSTTTGAYSADRTGLAKAAQEMAAWGGWYLWGGGHGTLEDLKNRIEHRFTGGRVMTGTGDTDGDGTTPNEHGVDCSGFVRAVIYQVTGVDSDNWAVNRTDHPDIDKLFIPVSEETALPGDVFFTGGHTGFIISNNPAAGTYEVVSAKSVTTGMGVDVYTYGQAVNGVYRWVGQGNPDNV